MFTRIENNMIGGKMVFYEKKLIIITLKLNF